MKPDEQIEIVTPEGVATAGLWWTRTPSWPGEKIGTIGAFRAPSAAATAQILARAGERLRAEGCTRAVGPMDGSTWRAYRFVTDAGTEPPFLLEPVNPPEWPQWWQAAGFTPLADYYSTLTPDLAARDPRVEAVAKRLQADGIEIRPLDPGQFEAELDRIYDVSVISFQRNFLYTPLGREEFVAQYRAIQSRVRPELVLLAEQKGRPVGYVFVLPDFAEAQRGGPVTTVIVKTLAVLPGRNYAGLGAVLLDAVHAAARRTGFTRAIHALMHETNPSRNLSAHYASTIRRYTLLARRLGAT